MAACVIVVERLEEGWYRASCTVFPELEVVAATEEEAREGFQEKLEEYFRDNNAHEPH
ncbi:MAG TPA: hypothetical protein VGY77_00980 [Gemmataceae bacterium]|nr:hypothetical protein [Gemmataceae bacterium]